MMSVNERGGGAEKFDNNLYREEVSRPSDGRSMGGGKITVEDH